MRKHKDRLDWNLVSQYQKLNPDFIVEMKDKVNWRYLLECQSRLPKYFREKYAHLAQ
jgi:hypothetical protein